MILRSSCALDRECTVFCLASIERSSQGQSPKRCALAQSGRELWSTAHMHLGSGTKKKALEGAGGHNFSSFSANALICQITVEIPFYLFHFTFEEMGARSSYFR